MIGRVLVGLAALGALATQPACRVCVGACKKTQGDVVTGLAPAADGSLTVTRCALTTQGTGASTTACRPATIPAVAR